LFIGSLASGFFLFPGLKRRIDENLNCYFYIFKLNVLQHSFDSSDYNPHEKHLLLLKRYFSTNIRFISSCFKIFHDFTALYKLFFKSLFKHPSLLYSGSYLFNCGLELIIFGGVCRWKDLAQANGGIKKWFLFLSPLVCPNCNYFIIISGATIIYQKLWKTQIFSKFPRKNTPIWKMKCYLLLSCYNIYVYIFVILLNIINV
jgi:hypothetical protein